MAAGNAPQRVAAELDEEERKLSACLATSSAQLEAHAQALLRRSIIRSTNGDRDGALEDAEGAVALFPKRPEVRCDGADQSSCILLTLRSLAVPPPGR